MQVVVGNIIARCKSERRGADLGPVVILADGAVQTQAETSIASPCCLLMAESTGERPWESIEPLAPQVLPSLGSAVLGVIAARLPRP